MPVLNRIRSRRWTRWVVLLHLLVVGVASAAPWLRDDDGQLAPWCGASRSLLAAAGADGDDARTLDCPLCLPLQAPPVHNPPLAGAPVADALPTLADPTPGPSCSAALPPARGPPTV